MYLNYCKCGGNKLFEWDVFFILTSKSVLCEIVLKGLFETQHLSLFVIEVLFQTKYFPLSQLESLILYFIEKLINFESNNLKKIKV